MTQNQKPGQGDDDRGGGSGSQQKPGQKPGEGGREGQQGGQSDRPGQGGQGGQR